MTQHYPRIRPRGVYPPEKEAGERLLAREVIHFAFCMPHDHPDLAAGVSHAFDCYMKAVGEGPDTINSCAFGSYTQGPLSEDRWKHIRQLLLPERLFRYAEDCADPYRFREMEKSGNETWIHLGNGYDRLSGFKLTYSARIPSRDRSPSDYDVSYLEGTLPTEYIEERGPSAVRELMLDLASGLHFASGHAGLSFDSLIGDVFFTPPNPHRAPSPPGNQSQSRIYSRLDGHARGRCSLDQLPGPSGSSGAGRCARTSLPPAIT
ncbi:hypothetical protein DAT35_42000 [Vitiosangium sp. GDMCC 1.1324]|nr:hypothetical protein DAT35_42000 [Vitiosangium sp. GDMCC 1.1324]